MTHNLSYPRDLNDNTEREIHAARKQRERRICRLLAERRQMRPPRIYTRATVIAGIAAVLDWVMVAFHTASVRGRAQDPMIGTHQALVATLSIIAACLAIGWAIMEMQRRFEVKRDEIEDLRHQDRTALAEWAMVVASNREWQSYAVGVREGQGYNRNASTDPHNAVVPLSQRTAGSRQPGHRYYS
ncbi:hypothetical protein [Micromonospora costi]|uniref:Uncharacterized protein n=1 Tax=Micromonospora costi TaxID=1530042 RepID=A0A3B0A6A6_9ACTN|nr:hypothetical protein [Micromonospora costi]RKN56032.1 hypothetical protein D7193_15885 [Micromonospora costi]